MAPPMSQGAASDRRVVDGVVPDSVYSRIEAHYSSTVARFGASPRGVDWTCTATQELRFVQLLKLCDFDAPFSLNDVGCGYGALIKLLDQHHPETTIDYLGIDLSAGMINRARRRCRGRPGRRFVVGSDSSRIADYSVMSGVMNVMVGHSRALWEEFVAETLRQVHETSLRGFAVNFLAENSSRGAIDGLYLTDPQRWITFCEAALGCAVEVVSGYGMREFTLLVRRRAAGAIQTCQEAGPGRVRRHARSATTRAVPVQHASQEPLDEAVARADRTIVLPEGSADDKKLHAAYRLLRERAPLHRVAIPGVRPFWAVTRYADAMAMERRDANFAAGPRTILSGAAVEATIQQICGREQLVRPLTHMDDPDHGVYRAISSAWFTPAALADMEAWLDGWAAEIVDRASRSECLDFTTAVAVPFSLRVIARLIGISEADEPTLNRLVRGLVGAEDPERRLVDPPANPVHAAMLEMRDFFDALAADRRAAPRHDLASVIANAVVNGAPLPHYERVSYYILLATAGYDTTAFAIAGGLYALITHPEQFVRLRRQPALVYPAVEEILRWTSPTRHFVRTATRDTMLGGQLIPEGDSLAIFFASANRDEAVFSNPDDFLIDRNPNPHIAFGRGPHICLGGHLARIQMRALFRVLVPRLVDVALAGVPRNNHSAFLTGLASLPIRCAWA